MSYMYKSPTGMSWDEFDDEVNSEVYTSPTPYMYKSTTGVNWSGEDDDFPSEGHKAAAELSSPPAPAGCDTQNSASGGEEVEEEDDDDECFEYLTPAVAKMFEESGMRPTYAFAVQQVWNKCLGRPAYGEFQSYSEEVHPDTRLNYSANWLHCKADQGVDMKVPLQFRSSRLAFSKTWTTGSGDDYIVESDGYAEQHDTHDSTETSLSTEDQVDQVDQGNSASATADTSKTDNKFVKFSTDISPVAFRSLKSDLGSENIFDGASSGDEYDEFDSELDSEEEDSDEKSDDENQSALASPISSATSDHGDVTEAELDEDNAASTSQTEDEDYCEVLDFTFPTTDQSTALVETAVVAISPIPDLTNAHAASPSSLEEPVGSESANHDLTATVDPVEFSKDTDFVLPNTHSCGVSSDEVQAGPLPSTVPIEVNSAPSAVSNDVDQSNYASYNQSEQHKEEDMAEFEDFESLFMNLDHVTGPVQDDNVFSPSTESLPSGEQEGYNQSEQCNEESCTVIEGCTPVIEESCPTPITVGDAVLPVDATVPVSTQLVDYSETKRNAEEEHMSEQSTSIAIPIPATRKANVSAEPIMASRNAHPAPHTRLGRTHTFTSLIFNTITTGYFAASSIPWTRIGVAAVGMGIVYNVATRILRR